MKPLLKGLANYVAIALVLPLVALYWCETAVLGRAAAFPGWSQAFSLLPGIAGVYLRRAFYRMTLRYCSSSAWISFGTVFSHPTASIGRNVYIGCYCSIGDVTIEDDVLFASHVSIANGSAQHGIERLDLPIREQLGAWRHVTIGADSWIGERTVVMANVGRQCVIGAGSVVTKPLRAGVVAVGSPTRVVRDRYQPAENGVVRSVPVAAEAAS